jgi:hypothetical protein
VDAEVEDAADVRMAHATREQNLAAEAFGRDPLVTSGGAQRLEGDLRSELEIGDGVDLPGSAAAEEAAYAVAAGDQIVDAEGRLGDRNGAGSGVAGLSLHASGSGLRAVFDGSRKLERL